MSSSIPTPGALTQAQAADYLVRYIQRTDAGTRRKLVGRGLQILTARTPMDIKYLETFREAFQYFDRLLFQNLLSGRCGLHLVRSQSEADNHRQAATFNDALGTCEWVPHPLDDRESGCQITIAVYQLWNSSAKRMLGAMLHEMVHAYLAIYTNRSETLQDFSRGDHSPAWYRIAGALEQCGESPLDLNIQTELRVDMQITDAVHEPSLRV